MSDTQCAETARCFSILQERVVDTPGGVAFFASLAREAGMNVPDDCPPKDAGDMAAVAVTILFGLLDGSLVMARREYVEIRERVAH